MIDPISASIPTIGQRQTAAKAMVAQGLQQIATQIYIELAKEHLKSGIPDTNYLQQSAKHALLAAQYYFSGLGIASFQENTPNG